MKLLDALKKDGSVIKRKHWKTCAILTKGQLRTYIGPAYIGSERKLTLSDVIANDYEIIGERE